MSSSRSEKQLKKRFVNLLKKLEWDPYSVESPCSGGIPDVNFIHGWVELKCVKEWPKRGGPLRIPHFTPQQRVWMRKRWRAYGEEIGYGVWMLLQVDSDYLWFDGDTASFIVGNVDKRKLIESAVAHWDRFPTAEQLTEVVIGR